MSKYIETLKELQLVEYFNDKYKAQTLQQEYNISTPDKKAAYDKHALLVIERLAPHNQNHRDNIESIKKNLQFISWLFIISIVIGVIAIIVELA